MAAELGQATNLHVEDPLSIAVDDILESDSVNVALLKESSEELNKETTPLDNKPSVEEVTNSTVESAPPDRGKSEETPVEVPASMPQANTLPAHGGPMMAPCQQTFANLPPVFYTPLPAHTSIQPGFPHQAGITASYVRIATPLHNNTQPYQCVLPAQGCQTPVMYPPPYPPGHQTTENLPIVTQQPAQNVTSVLPEFTSKSTTCWCPRCRANVQTVATPFIGKSTYKWSLFLCLCGGILCAIAPFIFSSFQDVRHTCPFCRQILFYYRRCRCGSQFLDESE